MNAGKARWFVVGQSSVAVLQLIQTMVLAWLLTPADFGVGAVCYTIAIAGQLAWDFGSSAAVIHRRHVTAEQLSSLYLLNLLFGTAAATLVVCAAPLIATLIDLPDATMALRWTALTVLLGAAGGQFRALHQKELLFRTIVAIEFCAAVVALGISIGAARSGAGYYSFVFAGVSSAAVTSAGFICLGWKLHRPKWVWRWTGLGDLVRFGGYQTGTALMNFIYTQLDVVLVGAILGAADLGRYSLAKQLCVRPIEVINPMVTRAALPIMARLQSDVQALRTYFLDMLRVVNALNVALFAFILVGAESLVYALFGPKWLSTTTVLQWLAAAGMLRSFGNPTGSLLIAVGQVARAFSWDAAMLLLLPLFLIAGSTLGGVEGTAIAVFAMYAAVTVPLWHFLVRPACGAGFAEWMETFIRPLICATCAGGAALIAARQFHAHGGGRLVCVAVCGAIVYLGLTSRFNRQAIKAGQSLW